LNGIERQVVPGTSAGNRRATCGVSAARPAMFCLLGWRGALFSLTSLAEAARAPQRLARKCWARWREVSLPRAIARGLG